MISQVSNLKKDHQVNMIHGKVRQITTWMLLLCELLEIR